MKFIVLCSLIENDGDVLQVFVLVEGLADPQAACKNAGLYLRQQYDSEIVVPLFVIEGEPPIWLANAGALHAQDLLPDKTGQTAAYDGKMTVQFLEDLDLGHKVFEKNDAV